MIMTVGVCWLGCFEVRLRYLDFVLELTVDSNKWLDGLTSISTAFKGCSVAQSCERLLPPLEIAGGCRK